MQKTIQFNQRKQRIQAIVLKSGTAALQRMVSDRNGFDADIRIAAHLELERRATQ